MKIVVVLVVMCLIFAYVSMLSNHDISASILLGCSVIALAMLDAAKALRGD